ncbi:MAG: hypothetical protein K2N01_04020 [Lachnospiraceae bacterium]|nr:hypothetical protein [Lachnospiraceae bacterium]
MTDSEKLDLLLEKVDSLEDKVGSVERDISGLKRQLMKSTAELKATDEMILDDVERVHTILDKHKADKAVHTA